MLISFKLALFNQNCKYSYFRAVLIKLSILKYEQLKYVIEITFISKLSKNVRVVYQELFSLRRNIIFFC